MGLETRIAIQGVLKTKNKGQRELWRSVEEQLLLNDTCYLEILHRSCCRHLRSERFVEKCSRN
jgi:hypothetical protein